MHQPELECLSTQNGTTQNGTSLSTQKMAASSIDSWGMITKDNLQEHLARTTALKPSMMELAAHVREIMESYEPADRQDKPIWFLNDGTLLGAFRNGLMIPHDYDVDFGVLFIDEDGSVVDLERSTQHLIKLHEFICRRLKAVYKSEGVSTTYSTKIMVYEPSQGFMSVKGCEMFAKVSVDLQLYYSDDKDTLEVAYFRDNLNQYVRQSIGNALPLGELEFEGLVWPCPNNVAGYLKSVYGYIGTPAKYNKETRKYEEM